MKIIVSILSLILTLSYCSKNSNNKQSSKINDIKSKSQIALSSLPKNRQISLTYQFTINNIPKNIKTAYAWVPVPMKTKYQKLYSFKLHNNLPYKLLKENKYKNHFLKIDLTNSLNKTSKNKTIKITFEVNRKSYNTLDNSTPLKPLPQQELQTYLLPNKLIPISGKIYTEAQKVTKNANDTLSKAKLLYYNVINTMVYNKTGTGWGKGDANYACDIRKGNCTDFHSLFIGHARSLKIPSRFIIGFPLDEKKSMDVIPGYHCWTEFYVDNKGWVPIDASEAYKHPEKREMFFGGLDANRIQFTMGRDIELPESEAEPLNYIIYPHVEINNKIHTKLTHYFSYKEKI